MLPTMLKQWVILRTGHSSTLPATSSSVLDYAAVSPTWLPVFALVLLVTQVFVETLKEISLLPSFS